MQRELCAYLNDISQSIEAIRTFTVDIDYDTFHSTDVILSAVVRKFEIIGEALKQSSTLYPNVMVPVAELQAIIGQRNRIAHTYFDLDPLIFWQSIPADLPTLLSQIDDIRKRHCS